MRPRGRWGALVAAAVPSLLGWGCSGSPAREVVAAPAASAEPPPEPPAEEAPRPQALEARLTSPVARLAGDDVLEAGGAAKSNEGRWHVDESRVRMGRGELAMRRFWRHGEPGCPLAGWPSGCSVFSLALAGDAPGEEAWNGGDPPDAPAPSHPRWAQAPRAWDSFSGGRSAVYAIAKGKPFLDRIDEQGRASLVVEDPILRDWSALWVIEQGPRTRVLAALENGQLRLYDMPKPGERFGEPTQLPITVLRFAGEPTARAARYARFPHHFVLTGEPRFVTLSDQGEPTDRWAMAWIEVVPPAKGTPRGKPQDDAPAKDPPKGSKARHGCGGPSHGPSRPLSDPSVEKKIHVTYFSGTTMGDDTVVWSDNTLDPKTARIEARLEDGKVKVQAAPKATGARRFVSEVFSRASFAEDSLQLSPDEALIDAAFDPESKEGLVVAWRGGRISHRRFDAEGKFLGPAVEYPHGPLPSTGTRGQTTLRRHRGRWFALLNEHLVALTDGSPPLPLRLRDHAVYGLAVVDGALTVVSRSGDVLYTATFDEQVKRPGPARRFASLSPSGGLPLGVLLLQPPGAAPLAAVDEEENSSKDGRSGRAGFIALKPGSPWRWIEARKRPSPPERYAFREVPGDLVLSVYEEKARIDTWLQAGRSFTTEIPEKGGSDDEALAPLLLPPSKPGPMQADDSLRGVERECPWIMHTGAATLLACASGVDPVTPGVRVSLRRLASGAPR